MKIIELLECTGVTILCGFMMILPWKNELFNKGSSINDLIPIFKFLNGGCALNIFGVEQSKSFLCAYIQCLSKKNSLVWPFTKQNGVTSS